MKRLSGIASLVAGTALAYILLGCSVTPSPSPTVTPTATVVPTRTSVAPTSAPTPAQKPTATPVRRSPTATGVPTLAVSWQRTQIASAGLAVDAPKGWKRLGLEWAWARPNVEGERVGLNWADRRPGFEPTSLLPNHSVSISVTPLNISWGSNAMIHTVEVTRSAAQGGGREAIETHILVLTEKQIYDLYASARSENDLAVLNTVLLRMVRSVTLAN